MTNTGALEKLRLAQKHLDRVQAAWDEPTNWDDLSLYGFYCLEAAIVAAATHIGLETKSTHWAKADVAQTLHEDHGLPDIQDLLRDLNQARKAAAYGDIVAPDLDPEDVASEIESYMNAVEKIVKS